MNNTEKHALRDLLDAEEDQFALRLAAEPGQSHDAGANLFWQTLSQTNHLERLDSIFANEESLEQIDIAVIAEQSFWQKNWRYAVAAAASIALIPAFYFAFLQQPASETIDSTSLQENTVATYSIADSKQIRLPRGQVQFLENSDGKISINKADGKIRIRVTGENLAGKFDARDVDFQIASPVMSLEVQGTTFGFNIKPSNARVQLKSGQILIKLVESKDIYLARGVCTITMTPRTLSTLENNNCARLVMEDEELIKKENQDVATKTRPQHPKPAVPTKARQSVYHFVLDNGKEYYGNLLSQNDMEVKIKTEDGLIISFPAETLIQRNKIDR